VGAPFKPSGRYSTRIDLISFRAQQDWFDRMKIACVASIVLVLLGFAAVASFAQPAGVYEMEIVSSSSSCAMDRTTSLDISRTGPSYSCSAVVPSGSTYRDCNSTHIFTRSCASSDCSGPCTIGTKRCLGFLHVLVLTSLVLSKATCFPQVSVHSWLMGST
jgi:hypothetical protein